MQVRAIFEAACNVAKKDIKVHPEIMVPLVGIDRRAELRQEAGRSPSAAEVMKAKNQKVEYQPAP